MEPHTTDQRLLTITIVMLTDKWGMEVLTMYVYKLLYNVFEANLYVSQIIDHFAEFIFKTNFFRIDPINFR